jgi:peptidoglycan/LPS O-acetylase OafA/YrhL
LNAVRLVLAIAVIFSHSFPLGGWGADPFFSWFNSQENLGGVAVIGFFILSGYLITKSASNKDIFQYIWARALRIFPAFWLVLLFAAMVIGPLIWAIEGRDGVDYLVRGGGGPLGYLVANWDLSIQQWGIFDIFANSTPYGQTTGQSVFNGSLWTLTYEWTAYLIIGVIVLFGAVRHTRVIVPALLVVALLAQTLRLTGTSSVAEIMPLFADQLMVNLLTAFLWGALFAVFSRNIIVSDGLGALALAVTVFTLLLGGFGIFGFPAFGYFLLWASLRAPMWIKRIGAKNDYSYGIYLYGFLVQQVLSYFGWFRAGYVLYTIAAIILSALLAVVSWHLIERPALSLKDKGPGKGIRYWMTHLRSSVRVERRKAP